MIQGIEKLYNFIPLSHKPFNLPTILLVHINRLIVEHGNEHIYPVLLTIPRECQIQ